MLMSTSGAHSSAETEEARKGMPAWCVNDGGWLGTLSVRLGEGAPDIDTTGACRKSFTLDRVVDDRKMFLGVDRPNGHSVSNFLTQVGQ